MHINQSKLQCDADKNYLNSNPKAIEKYLYLKNNKQLISIYRENNPIENCYSDNCVNFNTDYFEYIEQKFDDSKRKGIYTIYVSNDLTRKNCFEHNPASTSLKNKCFYSIKYTYLNQTIKYIVIIP